MSETRTIGIVGAGTMGSGIAQCAALSGYRVVAVDVSSEKVGCARDAIEQSLERFIRKGTVTVSDAETARENLSFATEYDALKSADLLVEAATESAELKASILQRLSAVAKPSALIATNTSSLSVTKLSRSVAAPASFIGIHFFNPVAVMPLIEIVKGAETSEATTNVAIDFAKQLGKTPIVVRNSPGFVVNRLLIPMINEAFFVLGEGVASAQDIDEGMKLGANHPLGPLALADLIGLDVCLAVMEVLLHETGDPKYRAAPYLREYVSAGQLGRKTGRGVYPYRD